MTLLHTPLHGAHERLGARMVPFAGWHMPVQYAGVVEEHRAVRSSAGVFDVSHMGEFRVDGPGAEGLLQAITPNDVAKLKVGRAHYSAFLTEGGTYVDDLLVYRLGPESFMVVVNAANAAKDWAWITEAEARLGDALPGAVRLRDESKDVALIALQGPKALEVLTPLHEPGESGPATPDELRYYGFSAGSRVAGHPVDVLSRTGYTGEDGFELYLQAQHAEPVWDALLENEAVRPAGLGARDTLRLEAGMCLYGNDIDETVTPLEAGLQWTVKWSKGDFTGRKALEDQRATGARRRLVGLEVKGRGIARQGHAVRVGESTVGRVTSGTHSPTLERPIAMAQVETAHSDVGTRVVVDVRGRDVEAEVVELPFLRRDKA